MSTQKNKCMCDEIEILSRPLVEYMKTHCDPYTYVVVSVDSICLMRTESRTPTES